jgi:pyruvate formate lyase activating enzyme
MKIGGFSSLSLNDYPGEVAALVFTQGCNFRCPFCHNGSLLPMDNQQTQIPQEYVFEQLVKRKKMLGGVVVTGGEPTLQKDLALFIKKIKDLGLKVKLDTNGSKPDVVKKMIEMHLVDFIAMDIKAPLHLYDILAGAVVNTDNILNSIRLIAESGLKHEFRTTYVKTLLSEQNIKDIRDIIPVGSTYKVQTFIPDNALDHNLMN